MLNNWLTNFSLKTTFRSKFLVSNVKRSIFQSTPQTSSIFSIETRNGAGKKQEQEEAEGACGRNQ
jgi:hypothetical protein